MSNFLFKSAHYYKPRTSTYINRTPELKRKLLLLLLSFVIIFSASKSTTLAEEAPENKNPYPGLAAAPELKGGKGWLNTSGPIEMKDLKGKVVILDFWTYCCINCIHVLPDLKFLEEKYPNELVVIGVHSAKFLNEKGTGNIRNAIMRYGISHPVVNDSEMTIWRTYGIRSWPSIAVIDPEGKFVGKVSGEGKRDLLDEVVGKLATYHRAKGTLDETPIKFQLEKFNQKPTPLRYPGKILADAKTDRLFISDSSNNRIVITTLNGKLIDVVGCGKISATNGGYEKATFDHPQGMALDGNLLYVADTENHLIRIIDLDSKTVSTLSGTGKQARNYGDGGPILTTALNSPWDLSVLNGILYIAMAGPHQIWAHQIGSKQIERYAGTGREDIVDGPVSKSALAQPSGLVNNGKDLFLVDSEGSAVRRIVLGSKNKEGKIITIAGPSDLPGGRSLFEFGDIDGVGSKARLQHPIGLAYYEDKIYVADSYNHKIKILDPVKREVKSWIGTGKPGGQTTPVMFSEPAGLAGANGKLYVADTNNHRVLVVDIQSGKAEELKIAGLTPPKSKEAEQSSNLSDGTKVTKIGVQKIAVTAKALTINIEFDLPKGFKPNTLAPVIYQITTKGKNHPIVLTDPFSTRKSTQFKNQSVTISIPVKSQLKQNEKSSFQLSIDYQYCRDGKSGVCKLGSESWEISLEVSQDGKSTLNLKAKPE